jgi:hypothetical protein
MKELLIHATSTTPKVVFQIDGTLSISGRSIQEDAKKFFKPIQGWISEILKIPPPGMSISFQFEYCDTATLKNIHELLQHVKKNAPDYKNITVKWYYESGDDEIKEQGYFLKKFSPVRFELIETFSD